MFLILRKVNLDIVSVGCLVDFSARHLLDFSHVIMGLKHTSNWIKHTSKRPKTAFFQFTYKENSKMI